MIKLKEIFGEDIYRTGIYRIGFKKSEHFYVGMAGSIGKFPCQTGFYRRWKQHFLNLRKNTHKNLFLQRCYNKYGKEDMIFTILEYCEPDKCFSKEKVWFELLKPVTNFQGASKYLNPKYCPISKDTKERRRLSRIGFKHSDETKRKMSLSALNRSYNKKILDKELILMFVDHVNFGGNLSEFYKKHKTSPGTLKRSVKFHEPKIYTKVINQAIINGKEKSIKAMKDKHIDYLNKTKDSIDNIVILYRDGLKMQEVAEVTGVNSDLVGSILKEKLSIPEFNAIKTRHRSQAQIKGNTSPPTIGYLFPNEIFVFGSNLAGRHGKGAAKTALKWGAIYGQGIGPQGNTFAIPTKDENLKILSTDAISEYVDEFILYAKRRDDLTFLVTEIGCGLSKYKPKHIAPLFKDAKNLKNVKLPIRFIKIMGNE